MRNDSLFNTVQLHRTRVETLVAPIRTVGHVGALGRWAWPQGQAAETQPAARRRREPQAASLAHKMTRRALQGQEWEGHSVRLGWGQAVLRALTEDPRGCSAEG